MFGQKRIWHYRWKVCLYILSCLDYARCYDPCPEMLRHSAADNTPNVPEYFIEGAFSTAYWILENENRTRKTSRVYPKGMKIPETVHPQATHKQEVPHMEARQRIFEEASKNLAENLELSLSKMVCGLPKIQLRGEYSLRAFNACHLEEEFDCSITGYRSADGSCNNLYHPTWGRAFSPVNRILLPSPTGPDGLRKSTTCDYQLPNPRMVSSYGYQPHQQRTINVNNMYVYFGQFLTHDITFTAQTTEKNGAIQCCPPRPDNHPQCAPIDITGFPFYNGNSNSTCINFVRSAMYPSCTLGHRTQINAVTSFIDGSQIYGSSLNEMNSLRTLDGSGSLLIQNSRYGTLLPKSIDPDNDRCSVPKENQICFRAGDQRVNQNPMLTSMQTIWVREHNRIAIELKKINPHWDEEKLFQESRRIVIAELQAIVIKEYLPLTLGDKYMNIFSDITYNDTIDPTIYTEFSTAAFRFGHSMIDSTLTEMPRRSGHSGHLLRDKFADPFGLFEGEVNLLIMGASRTVAQAVDRYLVPDVTEYLYRTRGQSVGLDLAALNIQRGRDHALPSYVDVFNACNPENPIETYFDLEGLHVVKIEDIHMLRGPYRYLKDVDLWVGMISELPVHDGILGPTAACIIEAQFRALIFGDRYWYSHKNEAGSFTEAQLNYFRTPGLLTTVICANTDITDMPLNAMKLPNSGNPIQRCRALPRRDLNAWQEK